VTCRFVFVILLALLAPAMLTAADPPVRITLKPAGLVHGELLVPVTVAPEVTRVELRLNGIRHSEQSGRNMVFEVPIGHYIRRMRIAVSGYDAEGNLRGEDEMVVNDPRPPFRVRLTAEEPQEGTPASMFATVTAPPGLQINGVDFYLGETLIGSAGEAPWRISYDPSHFPAAGYARAVTRAAGQADAHDVRFFGTTPHESLDVVVQRIAISTADLATPQFRPDDLELIDSGEQRTIEAVLPASSEPLSVLLLIDSSESMLGELPLLKQAAREFARQTISPNSRIALVGFYQRTYWMTPFTDDLDAIDRGIDQLRPLGQTHLYDAMIEMLFELQKREGRKALVVLTDGANNGGEFTLDHLVHYARYSGVPIYPVIKNSILSRAMKFGIGRIPARRAAQVARDTGATYFIIERESQLERVYATIARELQSQQIVVFQPRAGERDRWRPLRISRRDGRPLRAPAGYFAD
jgi:Ca-activated chloride channel homolog